MEKDNQSEERTPSALADHHRQSKASIYRDYTVEERLRVALELSDLCLKKSLENH